MPHADHANFGQGLSKKDSYDQVLDGLEALIVENWVSNLANASSLLWHHFQSQPAPQVNVNWSGFYVTDDSGENLVLGPFHGKVACQSIKFGRGVCGLAAKTRETQIVDDVHAHDDHISCDADTASEIVVPIVDADRTLGVLDVDCMSPNGFDDVDARYLKKVAAMLAPSLKHASI